MHRRDTVVIVNFPNCSERAARETQSAHVRAHVRETEVASLQRIRGGITFLIKPNHRGRFEFQSKTFASNFASNFAIARREKKVERKKNEKVLRRAPPRRTREKVRAQSESSRSRGITEFFRKITRTIAQRARAVKETKNPRVFGKYCGKFRKLLPE